MSGERSRSDFDFTIVYSEQSSASDGVMLAIVDHAFMKGEIARTVREPESEARGIVVLSVRRLDDHALFLGTSALEMDVQRIPAVTEPRVLHVWDDGRVTGDTGDYLGSVNLSLLPDERSAGVLQYLQSRTAATSTVVIPQIGRARLMRF